jgi:hypothetical protein
VRSRLQLLLEALDATLCLIATHAPPGALSNALAAVVPETALSDDEVEGCVERMDEDVAEGERDAVDGVTAGHAGGGSVFSGRSSRAVCACAAAAGAEVADGCARAAFSSSGSSWNGLRMFRRRLGLLAVAFDGDAAEKTTVPGRRRPRARASCESYCRFSPSHRRS